MWCSEMQVVEFRIVSLGSSEMYKANKLTGLCESLCLLDPDGPLANSTYVDQRNVETINGYTSAASETETVPFWTGRTPKELLDV